VDNIAAKRINHELKHQYSSSCNCRVVNVLHL
jgi:hypothetical protein